MLRLPRRRHAVSTTVTAMGTAAAVALAGTSVAFAEEDADAQAQAADSVTISVSNITDMHGHLSNGLSTGENGAVAPKSGDEMGVALLQSLIKRVNEGQEYALTTSGDNVGGSAYISAISEDEYTLEALNAMGVSASAVGNHEFDKGTEDLMDRIAPRSSFPVLGGNVIKDGQPLLDASYVQNIGGVKVGFVGTVTQNTENKVAPALIPGITFTDPVAVTNQEATRLKQSGEADVVVALMHEDAAKFAPGFNNDVDVLFGGDTHVRTAGTVERQDALPLQWAQGYEYGKVLNDVDITFDKAERKVTDIELTQYDATNLDGVTEDPALAAIVAEAAAKAKGLGSAIVGTTPQALYRGSDEGAASGSNRGVESTLNNYIAEAQRSSMATMVDKTIDIGIMNAGGVRADLKAGKVSYEDIFTVQPFGNAVSYGLISGADFIKALENQWQPGKSRPRLALGVSNNVQVIYDQTAAQDHRVTSVTINGEEVDPAKDYSIAASTFLIGGGDSFFDQGAIKDTVDVGYMDTQAMIDYIKTNETVVRTGQSQVGAHITGQIKAGQKITVDLSSLNYTSEGEPMAKKATLKLGDVEESADIDNAAREGDAQIGERGRATMELTIPANLSGKQNLEITTDAGTHAVLVLDLGGNSHGDGSSIIDGSSGSSNNSALGGGILAAILAAFVGVVGVVGLNPQLLPAPVRQIIENFRSQFAR
ncbi:bifunctional metallophosphatase/5'-nucleotidase [Corynebacterium flavescens]|uniref:bifunctional metallophosphatase/5'-nucleotidase n=1 Tax=Corynebacterium flavescens TaxID=28028 RepID=UPI00289C9E32|nr:bifunctional UDP-sugar hydrolase/5'-nucleotidase [Corynebacterium flavescens]